MNYALISPNELVYSYDGILLGERIAEISKSKFEVAPPLYWIECADDVNADDWYFNVQNSQCELKPVEPTPIIENIVSTSIPPENSLNVDEIIS